MRHPSTKQSYEERILAKVAEKLGVGADAIDPRRRFQEHGVDSARATAIAAELAELLGRPLPATLLWDHPTVDSLARHLAGDDGEALHRARPAMTPAAEPIAVIGLACRVPGAASAGALFRLLCDGVDAITEVPASRWDAAAIYDPDPRAPGKAVTRWGGFLEAVDRFDAAFFGISPREAAQMDPQQRLMLELCWEALEEGSVPPLSLRGSRTAVVFGSMGSEYGGLSGGLPAIAQHSATGRDTSIIAARVSYVLGLNGPSFTVNTACSSSLVAVHLACQSLLCGESELALAGGVSLMLAPDATVAMSKFGGMAPDGRAKAFDARADGYVRGEGGGVVLLKPLSRALADGDPIHALIRGSAVNNDGFSNGLSAPSPEAQEAVLREAYAQAGVDPRRVAYVEAHGTGTYLGDPIEATALGKVLGAGRPPERPLLIGSLKTNIGHLEAAAGVVGLIKASLSIERRTVPPNLHFHAPNPQIPFEALHLSVPSAATPWPRAVAVDPAEPRSDGDAAFAGVSSFGFGGTNCHVVLGSAPFSMGESQPATTIRALETSQASPGRPPRVAFVFSGNGSAWAGMARDLLGTEPAFRAAVARCDRALAGVASHSVLDDLARGHLRPASDVEDPPQLALFAVQVALAELLRSWGIEPDAVVGHSVGEVSAAYVAGALDLEDAVRVVHHRGRLQRRAAGKGAMAALALPRAEVEALLRGTSGKLGVAADNGPAATVVSGEPAALVALCAALQAQGVRWSAVHVDIAGHSAQMEPLCAELVSALHGLRARPAAIPIVSTVHASLLDGRRFDASYWSENLREPVRFAEACAALRAEGETVFVELSPHPLLVKVMDHAGGRALASLSRGEDGAPALRRLRAELAALGVRARSLDSEPHLFPLSASTEAALREVCAASRAHIAAEPDLGLADLCYTAAVRRSHHDHRLAIVADSLAELDARLGAFLDEGVRPPPGRRRRTAFVFSGHGSQWAGMGAELRRTLPVFRAALLDCDAALGEHLGWSVAGALDAPDLEHRLAAMDTAQPILFAMQVALAAVFRSWGIAPDAVVGHSLGEVAAAHVAGAISLEDAARIVWARSRALARVAGQGAMVVAEVTLDEAQRSLEGLEDRLSIAAVNAPAQVVLSGEREALTLAVRRLEQGGARCRPVAVGVAGHSPAVDPLLAELAADIGAIAPRAKGETSVLIVSALTGGEIDGASLGPGYWVKNLREPVRFLAAARTLLDLGHDTFVELSPHPVLAPALDETRRALGREALVTGSLRRGEGERRSLLGALGRLYVHGQRVELGALHPRGGRRLRLPPYPWQRERHWIEARSQTSEAAPAALSWVHVQSAEDERTHFWETEIAAGAPLEHYAEIARRAAVERWGDGPHAVEGIAFSGQLERDAGTSQPTTEGRERVQLVWTETSPGHAALRLAARRSPADPWRSRASGVALRRAESAPMHEIRWERARDVDPPQHERPGRFLIFADARGVATRLASHLEASGEPCVVIAAGDPRVASGPVGVREIVRTTLARDGLRALGVVYLSALDAPEPGSGSAARGAAAACAGLLHVAQALVAEIWDEPPHLWLVTAGAQPVRGGERVALGQAPVWGLGRVIAAEHPELRFAAVDLPADDPAREAPALARLLRAGRTAEQIALRDGIELTPRLVPRAEPGRRAALRLSADATYLITGGLGALGGEVGLWLAEAGARHLVLVGQSAPSAAGERALAAIARAGAAVTFRRADVTSPAQLAALLETIHATQPPLRGVLHAAGTLEDALLPDLREGRLAPVMAPKVDGAWNLHQLTAERRLDFFVLFSSVASWLGLAGHGSYAAANAFLDALAEQRRASGLPATSVGWGSFAGIGHADTPGGRRVTAFLARRGVASLSLGQGRAALRAVLDPEAAAPARVLVMPVEPASLEGEREGEGASRWDPLLGRAPLPAARRASRIRDELSVPQPASRRRAILAAHLTAQVASVLGLAASAIDAHAPMRALGMDSLMAIDLRDRLEASLAIPVATTLVWQRPTVVEMAAYLLERLDLDGSVELASPDPSPRGGRGGAAPRALHALLAEVELLSDEAARDELAGAART
jgi:acyl transferase domain-containing protein/acyl carrier protein